MLSRTELIPQVNKESSYKTFEYLDLTFTSGNISLRIISIYRPPPSAKNKFSFSHFLFEFSDFIERLSTSQNEII